MSGRRLLRLPLVVLALAVLVAGCGDKKQAYTSAKNTSASGEGTYLAAGGLKYQVQLSRELNPELGEDRTYLTGLPVGTSGLATDQEWFAIFIRVENEGDQVLPDAASFEITDAGGNTYKPIDLTAANVVAYQPGPVPPHSIIPQQNTIGFRGPTQGALVLFKLDFGAYQNRPLNLHVLAPDGSGETLASVQLDL